MTDRNPQPARKSWPDYRAVWRWHFYSSLFCMPFVVVLAISGSIYLFKPQIETWIDGPYSQLDITGGRATPADQVRAALAAVPESTPGSYELPRSPNAAPQIVVRGKGESTRVYVHPQTLEVLHTIPENERFMRWLFRLHGELLMGDRGSNLVELAASWTIVMIVSGLYLWWPRQSKGLGGIAYPRLRSGSRIFWRDLHSVTGVWISVLALFLLLSGLPWAKFWGGYFKAARRMAGVASARQDWSTGSERSSGSQRASDSSEHGGHSGGGRGGAGAAMPKDLAAFDRIVATVTPLGLAHPVVIAPPERESSDWTAKSMTPNRPLRVNLVVDERTGRIVSREDFADRQLIDRIVQTCIAAHEGQLFGWPNQALGLLTATGLVLLCVSGVVMWWRRREQGVLGAPKAILEPRVCAGLIVLVVLFAIYLPLFGASLLLVLLVEKAVLSRIPGARRWLGLCPPETTGASRRQATVGQSA